MKFYPLCREAIFSPDFDFDLLQSYTTIHVTSKLRFLLQELERQMMDVKTDREGGQITFSCNVAGYRPEELKVDVEGDSLIVKGFHFILLI